MAIPVNAIGLKSNSFTSIDEKKVTKVQAFVRGFLLRRKIEPEKRLLKMIADLKEEGLKKHQLVFNVFVFDRIVIKKRVKFRKDYQAHQEAISLCQKEKLDRLTIPDCRIYKNLIVETRLPISPFLKEQIGLYIENSPLFDQAVKQFVTFYFHGSFEDIVGESAHPYSVLLAKFPRYDNVSFYIEGGVGKIALIDLERFELNKTKSNRNLDDFIDRLVTLFPFQADLIMEEVKALFPGRALSCEKHRSAEKRVLDFFERVYSSHKAFLHSKNISPENPKGGQISQDETDKIILETESDPFKVESTIKRLNETISSIDSGLAWQTLLSKRSPHLSFEDMDIRVLKTLQKRGHIHAYFSFSGSVIVHL